MKLRLFFGALVVPPTSVHSFLVPHTTARHCHPNSESSSSTIRQESSGGGDYDYEYIAPNPDASPDGDQPMNLPSAYPPGTPSVLRGEAVRSALRSGRCIGWSFDTAGISESPLSMGGILQVQGKGTIDFLNNKLTQTFDAQVANIYQEGCLLDAKGRVVDRLRVAITDSETAILLTSPRHSSKNLAEERLDPFIFPMDQITLQHLDSESSSFVCTLASTKYEDIQKVLSKQAFPNQKLDFPPSLDRFTCWDLEDGTTVLVIPSTGLPTVACAGYTLIFYGSDTAKSVGYQKWQYLIGDANPEGPIGIGEAEYETLRIEAGQPAFGYELGNKDTKVSPLELHWQDSVDMDKGCYLGQEGVASMAKNPRGPPRTLYAVVFDDEMNIYETQSRGDGSKDENLTTHPQPGQTLYALGSNEQLSVGTITSVAESGSTGDRLTTALALVRRSDSIMKQMKEYDIEIPRDSEDFIDVSESSGIIQPPPLDPLDGLEVIIGGTFTVGSLQMIPSRRLPKGRSMFDEEIVVDMPDISIGTTPMAPPEPEEEENLEELREAAEKAAEEAAAAAAEAKRKAEKMELLRKRAEEAMARRKKKKENN